MNEILIPKSKRLGNLKLKFGTYLEFVFWDLEFNHPLSALYSMPFAYLILQVDLYIRNGPQFPRIFLHSFGKFFMINLC